MSKELRECPFCGGEGYGCDDHDDHIVCRNVQCGIYGSCVCKEAWQTRASDDLLRQASAALKMCRGKLQVARDRARGIDPLNDTITVRALENATDAINAIELYLNPVGRENATTDKQCCAVKVCSYCDIAVPDDHVCPATSEQPVDDAELVEDEKPDPYGDGFADGYAKGFKAKVIELEHTQSPSAGGWAENILAAIAEWKAGNDDGGGVIAKCERYARAALPSAPLSGVVEQQMSQWKERALAAESGNPLVKSKTALSTSLDEDEVLIMAKAACASQGQDWEAIVEHGRRLYSQMAKASRCAINDINSAAIKSAIGTLRYISIQAKLGHPGFNQVAKQNADNAIDVLMARFNLIGGE